MPYISKKDRKKLVPFLQSLVGFITNYQFEFSFSCGILNYLLTQICRCYLIKNKESYQTHNDIIGALENCKQEYYRRVIISYENKKIKLNGDVY